MSHTSYQCAALLFLVSAVQAQNGPPEGFSVVATATNADNFAFDYGRQPRLVLDANSDPIVTYIVQDGNNNGRDTALYYTAWNRAQQKFSAPRKLFTIGSVSIGYGVLSSSLSRDTSNNVLGIGYATALADNLASTVHVALSTDGGLTWKDQIVSSDPAQQFTSPSLALANGKVYFSYVHPYNGVRYVTGNQTVPASQWTSQLMPPVSGYSKPTMIANLALDSQGSPAVGALLDGDVDPGFGMSFWRPGSAPVLAGTSNSYRVDNYDFKFTFFGTEPRLAFLGGLSDKFFDGQMLWVKSSPDSGRTWRPFTLVPTDKGDTLDPPISLAHGSKGQSALVSTSNGSDGSGVCGTPKLSRATDFLNWDTCAPAPRFMPTFNGLDSDVAFDKNDRVMMVFSVSAGSDLPYGVSLWKEPSAAGLLPSISKGGVVHGASFLPAVSPGSLATIFGANFTNAADSAGSVPLPLTLASVNVTVNGRPAPLVFAGPNQINFQVPYETAVGNATVVVGTQTKGSSQPETLKVEPVAPGVFVFGSNRAVVQNQDYSVNDPASPALVGSTVTAYLTGSGPVSNPPKSGAASPSSPLSYVLTTPITAKVGNADATVVFAGLTPNYVGLLQLNITIPKLPAGDYPLSITIGTATTNAPMISVK